MGSVDWRGRDLCCSGGQSRERDAIFSFLERCYSQKESTDIKLYLAESFKEKIKVNAFLTCDFEPFHSLSSWLLRWRSKSAMVCLSQLILERTGFEQ